MLRTEQGFVLRKLCTPRSRTWDVTVQNLIIFLLCCNPGRSCVTRLLKSLLEGPSKVGDERKRWILSPRGRSDFPWLIGTDGRSIGRDGLFCSDFPQNQPAIRSTTLSRSLSALMPFCNAQHLALRVVPAYIDGLSDLTPEWEIVLVDDGSSDGTPDILCDFTQAYPQVKLAIHAQPRGMYLAYCTALALSRGEFLFIPLHHRPVSLDGLHRLWSASAEMPVVVGLYGEPSPAPNVECILLHRSAASPILPALSCPERLAQVLARFEPHVATVPLRTAAWRGSFEPKLAESYATSDGPEPSPPPPKSAVPRSALAIFSRLKQFALDE